MSTKKMNFRFGGLSTDEFAIIEDAISKDESARAKYNISIDPDVEKKNLRFGFRCEFKNANDNTFLKIAVSGYFEIKPEDWENGLDEEKTKLSIPVGFARHMGVLTIGAARGILHAKTERTPLDDFFLPTINLTEVFKEDPLIIELQTNR